jgi:hemoglobin-like flavoprotein
MEPVAGNSTWKAESIPTEISRSGVNGTGAGWRVWIFDAAVGLSTFQSRQRWLNLQRVTSHFGGNLMALSAQAIALCKASLPALQQHGLAITNRLYALLFVDPDIKAMFENGNADQPERLAAAIGLYAAKVDQLDALNNAVQGIAAKHVVRGVQAAHYPIVEQALLQAMSDVLGDAATPELLAAWRSAYRQLADILIAVEARPG